MAVRQTFVCDQCDTEIVEKDYSQSFMLTVSSQMKQKVGDPKQGINPKSPFLGHGHFCNIECLLDWAAKKKVLIAV